MHVLNSFLIKQN